MFPDGNDDRIFEISRGENNEGVLTLAKRLDREFSGLHLLTIKCFRPYERNVKAKRAKFDSMVSSIVIIVSVTRCSNKKVVQFFPKLPKIVAIVVFPLKGPFPNCPISH